MKTKATYLFSIVLLSSLSLAQSVPGVKPAQQPTPRSASSRIHVADMYGRLPMSFEANQGQTDLQVKFLSRGHGYTLPGDVWIGSGIPGEMWETPRVPK